MTARAGTLSVDGTPISRTDMARIQAEDELHSRQRRSAVKVVAAASTGADDCRTLLSILGLEGDAVASARAELRAAAPTSKRARKSHAA